MSDLLSLLQNRGITPRKNSTNHGGEYCSSCPVCGDGGKGKESNRFHIWPNRENGGKCVGRFWCRKCGISGDTIAFLQKVDALSYPQACAELGIPLEQRTYQPRSRYQAPPIAPPPSTEWSPRTYPAPSPVWMEKAANLLADCQARLFATQDALDWLERRGITMEMASTYGLGYNLSSKGKDRYRPHALWDLPKKMQGKKEKRMWIPRGWVIPSFNAAGKIVQLRIRRRNEDVAAFAGNIRYLPVDGSSMATMVLHPGAEVVVVVESGFDAILLAGITGGRIGAMTTWNSSARPDAYAHGLLAQASLILGALDYDEGGDNEQAWWCGHYRHYRRLAQLPGGAKDPGDAAAAGADLYAWLVDGLPRGLKIKLGFGGNRVASTTAPVVQEPEAKTEQSVSDSAEHPEVVEIELVGGKIIYLTNDKQQWMELAQQGKPVFSQNELERLQTAVAGLGEADRQAAVLKAVETKEIFGGYIHAGRHGVNGYGSD